MLGLTCTVTSGIIRLGQLYYTFAVLGFRPLHILGQYSSTEPFVSAPRETDVRYITIPFSRKEKLSLGKIKWLAEGQRWP